MYHYDEKMGRLKAYTTTHQAPLTNISLLCPRKGIFRRMNFNNSATQSNTRSNTSTLFFRKLCQNAYRWVNLHLIESMPDQTSHTGVLMDGREGNGVIRYKSITTDALPIKYLIIAVPVPASRLTPDSFL